MTWKTEAKMGGNCYKVGKVFSLEYTDIPEVFFMPGSLHLR
jgi:hypothetical protein